MRARLPTEAMVPSTRPCEAALTLLDARPWSVGVVRLFPTAIPKLAATSTAMLEPSGRQNMLAA